MPEVRFSVIVRCTRGAQSLPGLLRALGELDYPAEQFEVILADSNLRKTRAVRELPPTDFPLRYLSLRATSRAKALNIAVRESRGEFLAFLDENCLPSPDWLYCYDRAFEAWLAGVVGGSFQPPKNGNAYQKCFSLVHSSLARSLGLVTGRQMLGRYYPRSANMAARRESILLAGGFDEEAVECPEIRMVARMQHIGYRTFYCPEAEVQCCQEDGLLGFVGRDFRTAVEQARFGRRSRINSLSIGVTAVLVLTIAYGMGANVGRPAGLMAGGYALVLAISSAQAARSAGSLAVGIFLPGFLVIHHAVYALGSAVGRFLKV